MVKIDSTFTHYEKLGFNTKERLKYIYHFADRDLEPVVALGNDLQEDSIEVINITKSNNRWYLAAFENNIYSRQAMSEKEKTLRWQMFKFKVDHYGGFAIATADVVFFDVDADQFLPFLKSLNNIDLFNVGMRLDKIKDYQRSMFAFDELIKREYKPDTSHYKMGASLIGTKEYVEGIKNWEKAIQLNPDYLEAHMQLGMIFFENSHWKKAHLHFKEAERIKPNDDVILYHLAKSLIKLERYNEAYATIQRAVKLNPKNVFAKGVMKSLKTPSIRKLRKMHPEK